MLTAIASPQSPVPTGPYSQAVLAGSLVFLAGQRPVDPITGETPSNFIGQVEQALRNVQGLLQSAGTDLSNVVKLTVYLADLADFPRLNEALQARLDAPYPARTTVGVQLRDVLVELDVIAVVPGEPR